ncbi:MAG: hypothetical protein K2I33_02305, partial [Oscillospiraceae bacterium]|nr:hypothetical protein [Oscillospiraceae bacterium]
MVLTNLSNNLTCELGRYSMNFEEGTYSIIDEDIDRAFQTVAGLYVEPTEAPPVQQPIDSPQNQTDAPVPNDDSSSGESEE